MGKRSVATRKYGTAPWVRPLKKAILDKMLRSSLLDSSTAAFIARMTTPPSSARAALYNTLIISLKTAGLWDKLDVLYVTAAADSQAAGLNLKSSSYTLTPVNSPTFTVDRGYNGDGATSYLNTNYDPVGKSPTQDDQSIGLWVQSGNAAVNTTDLGNDTTTIGVRNSGSSAGARLGRTTTSVAPTTVTDATKLTAVSRSSATIQDFYKNGALLDSVASGSNAFTSGKVYLGARNVAGTPSTFSNRTLAVFFYGVSLSATEHANAYNAINTYLIGVGAA